MENCIKSVLTVAEGIQTAVDSIFDSRTRMTLRLVERPNGSLFVSRNDIPLPRDFRYIAVIQDARHRGEGVIIHWE